MEKAKYRVLRLSYIHNNLWPEGSWVEYECEPGSALEPLNDAAMAAKAKANKKPFAVTDKPVIKEPVIKESSNSDEDADSDEDSGAVSEDLATLRQQYEELFNEKPGNMKAETLKNRIAEKRQELGL